MLKLGDQICPFCSGSALIRFKAEAYDSSSNCVNVVECTLCQVGWQWPIQRTETQSAEIFNRSYSEHEDGTYFDIAKREAVATCQREFVEAHRRTPGRLLDIGCGDGTFGKNLAAAGWTVVGLDPALQTKATHRFTSGSLTLRNESIVDMPSDALFDVITLWDVVEHIEKPDQLIADAAARLAPGGILVVETGNYQSAGRLQSKSKWWNFQLDHRWYFAPPQLSALLKNVGLSQIVVADRVLRPSWKGKADALFPRPAGLIKSIIRRPWRAIDLWRSHNALVDGCRRWKGWSGLEIMTLVGRKAADERSA